jgi:hypothetical protein
MYGFEAATGLGGLAAQAQPNAFLGRTLQIQDPGAMIAGAPSQPGIMPGIGGMPSGGPVQVSSAGTQVQRPTSQQVGGWKQILDFHNSVAPWILIGILIVYGYVHISYRRGRANIGGGVA